MKYYKICYPDEHNNPVEEVLSEQDILDFYWGYWYEAMVRAMVRAGKRDLISPEKCVEQFVIGHMAVEVNDE